MTSQLKLLPAEERLEGFRYEQEFIDSRAEETLVARVRELPFQEFDFHGFKGKRRVVSFGWKYEYEGRGQLRKASAIPEFLIGLRSRITSFAEVSPDAFQQVLVT